MNGRGPTRLHPTYLHVPQMSETINVILTAYFAFDMAVKVIGLGMSGYLKDHMNAFDGVIVIASLAELAISAASPGGSSSSLSVLRTFRLLRVFKLARSWNELNKIVRTIFKSLASIAYLSLILLLFIFIVALLGMQLFGFKCAPARSFSPIVYLLVFFFILCSSSHA